MHTLEEGTMKLDDKCRIIIPHSIKSTFTDISNLINCLAPSFQCEFDEITFDFSSNSWFDSNLLPIVYAFIHSNMQSGKQIYFTPSQNPTFNKLLERNGFAKDCFGGKYTPNKNETIVPFKIFNSSHTYAFGEYIDKEIAKYFPKMTLSVKKGLSSFIQELFGNILNYWKNYLL